MPDRAPSSDHPAPAARDVQFVAEPEFDALPTREAQVDPRVLASSRPPPPASFAQRPDEPEVMELGNDDFVPLADPEPVPVPRGTQQISRKKDPYIGTTIGKYKLLGLLGTGGMADVYLVEHRDLGRRFALKRLKNERVHALDLVNRFFEEARSVSQIYHPNIVEITDFIRTEEHQCYVMEYLQGKPLDAVLDANGELPAERAVRITLQLCHALGMLHRMGVIHRDIKPANLVLVQRDGVQDFVKVLDFGIARFLETDTGISRHQTQTGMSLGTPGYMAPEQLLGGVVDGRADIYAVGVLLYQMVTGQNPFLSDTWAELIIKQTTQQPRPPSQVVSTRIPPALEALILHCLAQRPEDRPQTVGEIVQRLDCLSSGLRPGAKVCGQAAVKRRVRPWRWVAAGGISALLLTVAYLAITGLTRDVLAVNVVPPVPTAAAETSKGAPPSAAVAGPDDVTLSNPPAVPAIEKLKKKRVRRSRRRDPATRASDKLFQQFE